jgi:hypothetical protein
MRATVCSGEDAATVLTQIDDARRQGAKPTLAVVFCSVALDFETVGRSIAERGIAVVGTTTAGEISNDVMRDQTCVAMLLDAPPGSFSLWFSTRGADETTFDLGRRLGQAAVERFANPIVLTFVSGVRSDGEPLVRGVRAGARRPIPLFGGMAGDDLIMKNTFVFTGEGATADGAIGLVLDGERFEVSGIASNGWQAVGVEKTVTRSEANVVYEIDNEPALSVYKEYLDVESPEENDGGIRTLELGGQYPLSVRRENGTSVIRAPMFYQSDNQSMIFAGTVPQGSRVKFCIPPSMDVVERVVAEVGEVHDRMPGAEAVILVACIGRRLALGPLTLDEVQELYEMWGTPLAGFFSYGEIGARNPEECDFHTETCTLVALREIQA